MTERLSQPTGSGPRGARRRTPPRRPRVWGARTIPAATARELAQREPTLLGFPAEFADETDPAGLPVGESGPATAAPELRVRKRADLFGGTALVLAGVAANVSLSLSWWPGEGPTGLSLVQHAVEDVRSGMYAGSVWQPLAVVLCGGLLVLLGVLLLIPARAHRLLGVLALFVTLAAATAVLLLMTTGWDVERFGPGMWCAVAVPVLGLIGSLKAMLTPPVVTLAVR
jgi:hypothetical protein